MPYLDILGKYLTAIFPQVRQKLVIANFCFYLMGESGNFSLYLENGFHLSCIFKCLVIKSRKDGNK